MEERILGILKPLGGGDPIPLKKAEMIIGRRPGNDIRMDFENISGRHCMLRYIRGVWHARDLGSTNGTTVNGTKCGSEHSVLPDDVLKLATHAFAIDYEPSTPDSVLASGQLFLLDEENPESGGAQRRSLLEIAGISGSGGDRDRGRGGAGGSGRAKAAAEQRPSHGHDDDEAGDHHHKYHIDEEEEFELAPSKPKPAQTHPHSHPHAHAHSASQSKDKTRVERDADEDDGPKTTPSASDGGPKMSDEDFLHFFDKD